MSQHTEFSRRQHEKVNRIHSTGNVVRSCRMRAQHIRLLEGRRGRACMETEYGNAIHKVRVVREPRPCAEGEQPGQVHEQQRSGVRLVRTEVPVRWQQGKRHWNGNHA